MSKSVKKATPIRFHEGLKQLRKDAGGMDIGAGEIGVDVGLENDSEPVRRFETFTADLNRMAEWLSIVASRASSWNQPVSIGFRHARSWRTRVLKCFW